MKNSAKKTHLIFASPFLRVKETVEILCLEIDYSEVIFDDRLGEVFYGKEWEARTWSEHAKTFPALSERFYKRNSTERILKMFVVELWNFYTR